MVTDDLLEALSRFSEEAAKQPEEHDLHRRLIWLVDVLIARGQFQPQHRRIIEHIKDGRPPIRLSLVHDKGSLASPDVDCAALLPLCKGRCCSFKVSLSSEDVEERKLRWNIEEPYVLRKNATTGYCENMQRDGGCAAYHDRPATCRTYDCRNDPRVWIDYDQRIPAPIDQPVVPLGEWPSDT